MMDMMQFTSRPTMETIRNYPTIMDIVECLAHAEEQQMRSDSPLGVLPTWMHRLRQPGTFTVVLNEGTKMPVLVPGARRQMVFFRGQSGEHTPCVPSVWRGSRESWKRNEMLSQLQTAEMMLVMQQHPVIQFLAQIHIKFTNSFGQTTKVVVPIPYDALAQHYGIRTRYLDLTVDKWTAAFFAATDCVNGQYGVHYPEEDLNSQYGVFYILDRSESGVETMTPMGIFPVGMQYFNRPGRQSAYAMCMHQDVAFEQMDGVIPIYFRHDSVANEIVFAMSQQSMCYFPEDSFAGVVGRIVNRTNQSFAMDSVHLVQRIYYPHWSEDDVLKMVKDLNIEVEDDLCTHFTSEELDRDWKEWEREGKDRYIKRLNFMDIAPFPM